MANPWEFLEAWVREHVNATAHNDEATAKTLAAECLRDAKKFGFLDAQINKAANGNLVGFMLTELNSAANREEERLASKRD
jgi:hypothetical protein